MTAGATQQLALALRHQPDFSRDSFMVGPSNAAALALIDAWPGWPAPVVVLSGPQGSGKTHLAHVWAAQSGASIVKAGDLARLRAPTIDRRGRIVVEDVDPKSVPERALFHLLNSAKEAGADVLITARLPADTWLVGLADLRSRLRLAAPAKLEEPDDDLLRRALVKLFSDRQLFVEKPVIDYLLDRMERSLGAAVGLVAAIDQEALASGKRITRRLAAAVLPSLAEKSEEFTDLQ